MPANITQFTFEFLDVDYEVSVLDYFAIEKVSYFVQEDLKKLAREKRQGLGK